MAKHARPAAVARAAVEQGTPGEIARMDRPGLHFLLNYIALRHPEAYADARSAQEELAARNAAHRAQQEASVTQALDNGSGIWASYASAIQGADAEQWREYIRTYVEEKDNRAAREAGDGQP